jgi:hypothetical protein
VPARSARVVLHNQTNERLLKNNVHLNHGAWTPGWEPPELIVPGQTVEWHSESSGVLTGTEGWVEYLFAGTARTLYLHWDIPYISNFAKGNQYHGRAGDGYDLSYFGGWGDNGTVEFVLQYSVAHWVPHFRPSKSGFHFSNREWRGLPVISLPFPPFGMVPVSDAKKGMCGGMTFCARDYYEAGLWPPELRLNPSDLNDPLFQYIRKRLLESFDVDRTGKNYLILMDPAYPDTDENFLSSLGMAEGRSRVMVVSEWPKIRAEIDAGHPSAVALVRTKSTWIFDIGQNHQVLAYGYRVNGATVQLWYYDPNHPDDDNAYFSFETDNLGQTVDVKQHRWSSHKINCFFRIEYGAATPTFGIPKLPSVRASLPPGAFLPPAEEIESVRKLGREGQPVDSVRMLTRL